MTDETPPSLRSARAIILAAFVAALAILASSDAVHGMLLRVFEMSRDIITRHTVAGPIVFIVLAMLSAMLAFFSSAVLVAPAVFAWGPVNTALLLLVGWMLGGILSYGLARHLGRPALRWLARGRSAHREEPRLTAETPLGLVILFQLALPSEIPGFVLGLVRYPFARYLVALAIGELPYAVGTVLLGVTFVERRLGAFIALGAVAVLAILFLAPALRNRLRPDRGP